MSKKPFTATATSFCIATLIACGGGSTSDSPEPISDSEEVVGTGTLSLSITDGPVDSASQVVVVFNAIEIKPEEGSSITINLDEPEMLDLLALQNGESAPLIQNEVLTAGNYNWIRLAVDADQGELDSYITLDDGTTHSLYVPSGSETGLKLNRNFTIAAGRSVNFMIDFDLRKSVLEPNGQSSDYKLKPTLRVTDMTEVGGITGYINASLVADASCSEGLAVYVYDGFDITPDDEGSVTPPVTSALPTYDSLNDRFDYSLSFLSTGDYTVAVTCDADLDDPEIDEDDQTWGAVASANASVTEAETTSLNFE